MIPFQPSMLCLLAIPLCTSAAANLSVARIMPMGDSITLGVGGGGYREDLGSTLASKPTTAGRWSYAGLLYGNGGVHCGYNGQTIKFLYENVAERAFSLQPPTHLLIMAGTNDMFFLGDPNNPGDGANATECVTRMETLVEMAFSAVPEVTVLLSGVTHINATLCANYSTAPWHPPNCPVSMPKNIATYNSLIATRVTEWQSQGKKIYYHDPNCLGADGTPGLADKACSDSDKPTWVDGDYFTYGIHFSASGYTKMAHAWSKTLMAHWA